MLKIYLSLTNAHIKKHLCHFHVLFRLRPTFVPQKNVLGVFGSSTLT